MVKRYIFYYVDDMLMAKNDICELNKVKRLMPKAFEMKDLGHANKILRMEITRNRSLGDLYVCQSDYSKKILKKFNIFKAKPMSTPLAQHFKLLANDSPKDSEKAQRIERVPYSKATGSLMYLMMCTRPDLAYCSNLISRYMGNPRRNN